MKKQLLIYSIMVTLIILKSSLGFAQTSINFDPEGTGYVWEAFGNTEANNDLTAFSVVTNPAPCGINPSAKTAKYVSHIGAASWAGFKTMKLNPIKITEDRKWLTMDVFKTDTNVVAVKIEGEGGIWAYAAAKPTKLNEWETLIFDFTSEVGKIFSLFAVFPDDPGILRVNETTTYIDNITWHKYPPLKPITFDTTGIDYYWVVFDNTTADNDINAFVVVDNPDTLGMNASSKVGRYAMHAGAEMWAGVKTNNLDPIIVTNTNKWLTIDVNKSGTNNVGLKYEGGTGTVVQKDAFVTPEKTNEWETLLFDFSSVVGDTFPTFVIFPDWQEATRTNEDTIYFDNIAWHAQNPYPVVNPLNPITFEPEGLNYDWIIFDNIQGSFEIIDNPYPSGNNTSAKVGKYFTDTAANIWAGVKTNDLNKIIITDNNEWLTMKVYKTNTDAKIGLKVEGGMDNNQKDSFVKDTVANEWVTLVFDFSTVIGDTFPTFVIFPDWPLDDNRNGESTTTYFDDIEWHAENPFPTAINQIKKESILVYPNPAQEIIYVNGKNIKNIDIKNSIGQILKKVNVQNDNEHSIVISDLKAGTYFISIRSNNETRTVMFIKN